MVMLQSNLQRDRLDSEASLLRNRAQQAAQRGDAVGLALSELLAVRSTLASLRAASIAGHLSTASAHPEGASDAAAGKPMVAPRAEIVLTVLDDGRLLLKGYRMGRWNTTYANGQDSVLQEIPKLLAELREETAPFYSSGK